MSQEKQRELDGLLLMIFHFRDLAAQIMIALLWPNDARIYGYEIWLAGIDKEVINRWEAEHVRLITLGCRIPSRDYLASRDQIAKVFSRCPDVKHAIWE